MGLRMPRRNTRIQARLQRNNTEALSGRRAELGKMLIQQRLRKNHQQLGKIRKTLHLEHHRTSQHRSQNISPRNARPINQQNQRHQKNRNHRKRVQPIRNPIRKL